MEYVDLTAMNDLTSDAFDLSRKMSYAIEKGTDIRIVAMALGMQIAYCVKRKGVPLDAVVRYVLALMDLDNDE